MVAIGDRVVLKGSPGVVKYIGRTQFAPGVWCGIELDYPLGKNDGSVFGVRYFDLEKRGMYGLFAKLENVKKVIAEGDGSPTPTTGPPVATTTEVAKLRQMVRSLRIQLSEANKRNEALKMEGQRLGASTQELEGLQETVEKLTMNEVELSTQNQKLAEQIHLLELKNKEMQEVVGPLREEVDLRRAAERQVLESDEGVASSQDKRTLLLKEIVKKLEFSLNESLKQCEELLEKNSKLVADNLSASQKVDAITHELDLSKETIRTLMAQIEAQSDSEGVVARLTESNESLLGQLAQLKRELALVKRRDMHGRSEARLKSLTTQINELQEKLKDTVSALELKTAEAAKYEEDLRANPEIIEAQRLKIQDLELKVDKSKYAQHQNRYLRRFGDILSGINAFNNEMETLGAQLEVLVEWVVDDGIQNKPAEKLQAQSILVLLLETVKVMALLESRNRLSNTDNETDMIDSVRSLCDIRSWLRDLTNNFIRVERMDFEVLLRSLSKVLPMDGAGLLLLSVSQKLIGSYIPKVIAKEYQRTKTDELGKLYDDCLSLETQILGIMEGVTSDDRGQANKYFCPSKEVDIYQLLGEVLSVYFVFTKDPSIIGNVSQLKNEFSKISAVLSAGTIKESHKQEETKLNSQREGSQSIQNIDPRQLISDKATDPGVDQINQELSLRVKVLNEKVQLLTSQIGTLDTLKSRAKKLEELNKQLQKSESEQKSKILLLEHQLMDEKLKKFQLSQDSSSRELYMRKRNIDQFDLISEIQSLRQTIAKSEVVASKKYDDEFAWLLEEFTEGESWPRGSKHNHIYRELNTIQKGFSSFVDKAKIVQYDADAPERIKRFQAMLKFRRSNILKTLKETCVQ